MDVSCSDHVMWYDLTRVIMSLLIVRYLVVHRTKNLVPEDLSLKKVTTLLRSIITIFNKRGWSNIDRNLVEKSFDMTIFQIRITITIRPRLVRGIGLDYFIGLDWIEMGLGLYGIGLDWIGLN